MPSSFIIGRSFLIKNTVEDNFFESCLICCDHDKESSTVTPSNLTEFPVVIEWSEENSICFVFSGFIFKSFAQNQRIAHASDCVTKMSRFSLELLELNSVESSANTFPRRLVKVEIVGKYNK